MAISIVIKDDDGKQVKNITLDSGCSGEKWEEMAYQVGCQVAREIAGLLLESMEDMILQERPRNWKVKDSRERTRVTRFGDVIVSRRLYKDDKGVYRFI